MRASAAEENWASSVLDGGVSEDVEGGMEVEGRLEWGWDGFG